MRKVTIVVMVFMKSWWPSDQPSSENLEVMEAWTYTVTLADGTARQVTS